MVKNFKNIFLPNHEADDFETWYTASGTRVLTIFHMMTLGWPWLFLWQGQICFRMLLHGWKLIQHWVLMYFQVCSNSTYPQHSGERYRTNGPLVVHYLWNFVLNLANKRQRKVIIRHVSLLRSTAITMTWRQLNVMLANQILHLSMTSLTRNIVLKSVIHGCMNLVSPK